MKKYFLHVKQPSITTARLKGIVLFWVITVISTVHAAPDVNNDGMTTEKAAVQKVYYQWCQSITSAKGNAKKVVRFYAPDAILLPTLSSSILVNTKHGLDGYFTKLTKRPNIHCVPQELITQVYKNIAINTGTYRFTYADHGKKKSIPARFTFVYKNINGKWLIIKHHSSALP